MSYQQETEKSLEVYLNMLNFLSESSDDYFFLWHFSTQKLYLSESIRKNYNLMQHGEPCCTLDEWTQLVYARDLPALQEDLERIISGQQLTHNMEYRIFNRQGNAVWISCRGKSYLDADGKPLWMIGRVSDTLLEKQTDRLTGTFFMDQLKEELEAVRNDGLDGYLLLAGVDELKSINLKRGRSFGDQLLRRVAEALEDVAVGDQRIYRMNGDCFAICLPDYTREQVCALFQAVNRRLCGQCTLSGGCVPFREYRVPDSGTLYQFAENALDQAKNQGKNTLWFFSAADYEKDLAQLELKENLAKSIQAGFTGFSVVYQPQVFCQSQQLYGAEALLRYRSPQGEAFPPSAFIPLLEQTGMICDVGLWMMRQVLNQCRKWRRQIPDLRISVNMSYPQFCQPDIDRQVISLLKESGLPGHALTIELTESMQLMNSPAVNRILQQWKAVGIEISVDDFGTSYSSLSRLQEIRVDEIKIDRCFVQDVHHSAYNYRLLKNMLELAASSQIRICCEGIEKVEELAVLKELLPDILQGFLFSRPLTPEDFESICLTGQLPQIHTPQQVASIPPEIPASFSEEILMEAVLEQSEDIFYVSDMDTYELYYLNPAGQQIFGQRDYQGKKCYRVLQGRDEPCIFCTNHLLKQDQFYTWDLQNDYCGRHFLVKDKKFCSSGRNLRLEVAQDITKHEKVSQNLQERLAFAEKVVDYAEILTRTSDYRQAVQQVLAAVGEFHQADRAYLFERDPLSPTHWNNTFEWCDTHVKPQIHQLQQVPPEAVARWMDLFQKNQSVIMLNLEPLKETSPIEWEVLSSQDINRLIAVPMWMDNQLIGFIGVDNPRSAISDDSQVRVLSCFLINRIRQDRSEARLRTLLQSDYQNIPALVGVGLWVIYLTPDRTHNRMLADDAMLQVMGVQEVLNEEECYQFWHSRINDGYYHYVNQSVEQMAQTGRITQLEYTWKHPELGEVMVRCTGIRAGEQDGCICLKGYHRIISNIERPQALPEVEIRDTFEFNELTHSIFFHNGRRLLAGEALHESGFPQCWITEGIVHPHFTQLLEQTFSRVRVKTSHLQLELLLKSKNGTYEWYEMILRHPSREHQDLDTVVAVVKPCGAQRVLELEHLRIRRFYEAMLSEAIAYAEVDLESGELKSIGGLWQRDYERVQGNYTHFIRILEEQLRQYLTAEEVKQFHNCCSAIQVGPNGINRRFCYRRPMNGELRWVELVLHVFQEEFTRNLYALIYLRDIHIQKEREIAQAKAASRDPLTNILNRSAFEELVTHYLREPDRHGILMLLDVDNFKDINDQLGHLEGDQALKQVSQLLTTTFRQQDLVGRLGGDEFLIFVKGHMNRESLRHRLEELTQLLASNDKAALTSSIGITFVKAENFDYNRSLREADIALYRSKRNGKNSFCFYDDPTP